MAWESAERGGAVGSIQLQPHGGTVTTTLVMVAAGKITRFVTGDLRPFDDNEGEDL